MRSQFTVEKSRFLVARPHLCQNHNMKHLLLACLFPMTLTAQTMQQLTEQLGKTVLYGDIAFRPTAHMSRGCNPLLHQHQSKPTSVKRLETRQQHWLKFRISGERTDFDPAWSPDSKTLAFFPAPMRGSSGNSGVVNADGSESEKAYEPKRIRCATPLVARWESRLPSSTLKARAAVAR